MNSPGLVGVVLAGGRGTRLLPLTRVANKHLLPVYDRPMVFHALGALAAIGVRRAIVVCDSESEPTFRRMLESPAEHGLESIELIRQAEPRGIADALASAAPTVAGSDLLVFLADNLFGGSLTPAVEEFRRCGTDGMVLLSAVTNPREFGIANFDGSRGRLIEIIEKPERPPTDLAVTGAYFYKPSVLDLLDELRPTDRGDFEITDLNNALLRRGVLDWSDVEGWWCDAGTIEGLRRATNLVAEKGVNGHPPHIQIQGR